MVYKLLNNGKNFFFTHDDVILAINFHFRAGKLAEQHAVADFDIQRADFTVLALARANGDNDAFRRLFGSAAGEDDTRGGGSFLTFDDHAIVQRAEGS